MELKPKSILLPKLLPAPLMGLGYFIRKPLNPFFKPFVPEQTLLTSDDWTEGIESPFRTTISLRNRSTSNVNPTISAAFTSLFGVSVGTAGESEDIVRVEAPESYYRVIKFPDNVFEKICLTNAAAQEWINDHGRFNREFYFVVGLQVVQDAKLEAGRGSVRVFSTTGSFSSGSASFALPVGAGIEVDWGKRSENSGYTSFTARGESIWGIQVRKGRINFWNPKTAPDLLPKLSWKFPVERWKATGDAEEAEISVTLGDYLSEEEFNALFKEDEEMDLEEDFGEDDE